MNTISADEIVLTITKGTTLYVLASEATEREDELKDEINDLNTELTLANARNQLNPLPGDNMIHDEAEIRRLYAIAKTATERERVLVDIIEREASSLELFMHNKSSQSSHLKAIALRLRAALEQVPGGESGMGGEMKIYEIKAELTEEELLKLPHPLMSMTLPPGRYVLASEAQERERVLHKVIRSALKSMENMCSYPEDHKRAIELIHATLAQKGGGE